MDHQDTEGDERRVEAYTASVFWVVVRCGTAINTRKTETNLLLTLPDIKITKKQREFHRSEGVTSQTNRFHWPGRLTGISVEVLHLESMSNSWPVQNLKFYVWFILNHFWTVLDLVERSIEP